MNFKWFILLIAIIIFFMVAFGVAITQPKYEWVEVEYVVQEGETLWSIAKDYCPDDMDIRDYICEIQRINNIESNIYAEQTIVVLVIDN